MRLTENESASVPCEAITTDDLACDIPRDTAEAVTGIKPKKKKKETDYTIRGQFRMVLSQLDINELKKPWMADKSFRAITTDADLTAWVDNALEDESLWVVPYPGAEQQPVAGVDTETTSLDTRVFLYSKKQFNPRTGIEEEVDFYELNVELSGVCLALNGISGIYIPLTHSDGNNVSRAALQQQMQRLFDRSHLVFYHAKYDREILRHTLGLKLRLYPHFEDVQILSFLVDPKVKLDEKKGSFQGGLSGLKGLSKSLLGWDQIPIRTLTQVKARADLSHEEQEELRLRPTWRKILKKEHQPTPLTCATCEGTATYARTQMVDVDGVGVPVTTYECSAAACSTRVAYKVPAPRLRYVPFSWVPTEIAVWYAAGDAICTWVLWDYLREKAQSLGDAHNLDGRLIDALTWMERQRFLIDVPAHARLVRWHERTGKLRLAGMEELAVKHGWPVMVTDEGEVIPSSRFNPKSSDQLSKLLFQIKEFTPVSYTKTGAASTDVDTLAELLKRHPHDEFLLALADYREYVALHPDKIRFDPRDNSIRFHFKQATVAGGRLAAGGGEYEEDGGGGINVQAVKKVGGNWWVEGDLLDAEEIPITAVEPRSLDALHPSCFQPVRPGDVRTETGERLEPEDPRYDVVAEKIGLILRNGKWCRKAPGILNNHIANYLGFSICLVPGCTTCKAKHGVVQEKTKLDARQIINLRSLFIAPDGWQFCTTDYSNIEMRVATNVSKEPKWLKEFREGDGDLHTLTATLIFSHYYDAATTNAERKKLRGIAKIINFALLYGGTAYTIYETLKKENPDVTWEYVTEMVKLFWKGVPVFKAWADNQQKVGREQLLCITPFGREIRFESAMKALHIRKPTAKEMEEARRYWKLTREWEDLEKTFTQQTLAAHPFASETEEAYKQIKAEADRLYADEATGVRNAKEYNRFVSKVTRQVINIPLQGLAGEFMRIAIVKIFEWASITEPLVQSVLRVPGTVHDEIDYHVKNLYMPFVVPRFTRKMKLRALHAFRDWPVPIECDTEFGRSWDVKFHLTGDDGHKPSGWTDVPGLEEYLPEEFSLALVESLLAAVLTEDVVKRGKVLSWAKKALHPRSISAFMHVLWEGGEESKGPASASVARKQLFAALQLHEYWVIDATPDDADDTLETFLEFEQRCGLTEEDRGYMPEDGWLFSTPLDRCIPKPIPELGPEPLPQEVDAQEEEESQLLLFDLHGASGEEEEAGQRAEAEMLCEQLEVLEWRLADAHQALEALEAAKDASKLVDQPAPENDMLHPQPRRVKRKGVDDPWPIRPDLTDEEWGALEDFLQEGQGDKQIHICGGGKTITVDKVRFDYVPSQYLIQEMACARM